MTTLQVRDLTKHYKEFTLDGVSFDVPEGYVTGLIGPNGAGKTTLLSLLLDIVARDEGSIRIFGKDLLSHAAAVKSRIGWVSEFPRFYGHLTVRQCAALVSSSYPAWEPDTFQRLIQQFALAPRQRIRSLSRGSRTRLAMALALSHGAELLVLDEPTTGLDPVFRRELLELLAETLQDEKKSVIFSTQVTSDLDRIADSITYLENGRVRFSAGKEEIREHWAIIKGGPELLAPPLRAHFLEVRQGSYACEGLTRNLDQVRPLLRPDNVIEPPVLEELMVLLSEASHQPTERRQE